MLLHRQLLHADEAQAELRQKTIIDIERETAIKWGDRAAAAYGLAAKSEGDRRMQWLNDATNYRQESIEHAAMTGDIGLLKEITRELDLASNF